MKNIEQKKADAKQAYKEAKKACMMLGVII